MMSPSEFIELLLLEREGCVCVCDGDAGDAFFCIASIS